MHDGYFPKGNEEVEAKIDILVNEVNDLKNQLEEINNKSEKPIDSNKCPEGYIYTADKSKLMKKRE